MRGYWGIGVGNEQASQNFFIREGGISGGENFAGKISPLRNVAKFSPGEISVACDQQLHCLLLWAPTVQRYINLLSVQRWEMQFRAVSFGTVPKQPCGVTENGLYFICCAIFVPVIHPEPPRK